MIVKKEFALRREHESAIWLSLLNVKIGAVVMDAASPQENIVVGIAVHAPLVL
jgi:hypothetical protein